MRDLHCVIAVRYGETGGDLGRTLFSSLTWLLLAAASCPMADAGEDPVPGPPTQSLTGQANNPNAPLTQLQIRDAFAPRLPGTSGTGNLFELEAVLPFKPREFFPHPTLMKITVPYITVPDPGGESALGDIALFDQVVFSAPWGSWAVGFAAVFPSNTARDIGQDTWQLGPAAAIMYTGTTNLVAGIVVQNPASLNSGSRHQKANALSITPTLTYTRPDGWFAGYSDFDWTFDWESNGDATIPLGVQLGRVFKIGNQAFNASVEAGYNVVRPSDSSTPRWMIGFEFTALFPGVL